MNLSCQGTKRGGETKITTYHAITMLMLVLNLTDWSHQTTHLDNNNNVRDHEKTLHEAQSTALSQFLPELLTSDKAMTL